VHGTARHVDNTHPFFAGFDEFARSVYGIAIDVSKQHYGTRAAPDFTGFIEPRRIYAQGFAKVVGAR
jgi:hypothetical protein